MIDNILLSEKNFRIGTFYCKKDGLVNRCILLLKFKDTIGPMLILQLHSNGLVGVFGLHYIPNLRAIYLWFEDMRRDWFTLQKSTQPGLARSARTPSITQSVQKFTRTP